MHKMKKHHHHAMERTHMSQKKSHMHHSDPMVGGVSEDEGRVWGEGEFANMPREVKMKMYPKSNEFGPDVLDDTMGGIDKTNMQASRQTRRNLSNQH
jgi:hypothetical protein